MTPRDQLNAPQINFKDLRFNAKIDYITIHTNGKISLPDLDGKPKWPRAHHGNRLTVHDATAADINALVAIFGPARLIELEIAIDVRPALNVPIDDREELLRSIMVNVFARGLEPSGGLGISKKFRAFYRRLDKGYRVQPFNLGLPRATDQQLHGGRNDAVQVKGYLKTRDQDAALPRSQQVARVEVRLGSEGLLGHDLVTLTDLGGFKFRKSLMPYFSHVAGSKRLIPLKHSNNAVLRLMKAKQQELDQAEFERVGVGALLKGGKRCDPSVRLKRDIPLNDRLGQALMRLERQFRPINRADPTYRSWLSVACDQRKVGIEQGALPMTG
jgi:hypothetical protein